MTARLFSTILVIACLILAPTALANTSQVNPVPSMTIQQEHAVFSAPAGYVDTLKNVRALQNQEESHSLFCNFLMAAAWVEALIGNGTDAANYAYGFCMMFG